MILLLDGILAGLVIGYGTGGRIENLRRVRLSHEWLLSAALAGDLIWPLIAPLLGLSVSEFIAIWISIALMLTGVCLMNARFLGMYLCALGLAANVLVIAANGGMPVSIDRAIDAGVPPELASQGLTSSLLHENMTRHTVVGALGDVFFVPGPRWHRGMASIGDVLLSGGAGLVVIQMMHNRENC